MTMPDLYCVAYLLLKVTPVDWVVFGCICATIPCLEEDWAEIALTDLIPATVGLAMAPTVKRFCST